MHSKVGGCVMLQPSSNYEVVFTPKSINMKRGDQFIELFACGLIIIN
jgi:hypothetical protein